MKWGMDFRWTDRLKVRNLIVTGVKSFFKRL